MFIAISAAGRPHGTVAGSLLQSTRSCCQLASWAEKPPCFIYRTTCRQPRMPPYSQQLVTSTSGATFTCIHMEVATHLVALWLCVVGGAVFQRDY